MRGMIILLLCLGVGGCATPNVYLHSGAEVVRVAKTDPSDNYEEVGQVSGSDGDGCGAFGYRGIYERAVIDIKNKAHQLGADYVQIFTIREPHLEYQCFDNIYQVSGTAYKKVRDLPSPTPIINQSPGNDGIIQEKLKTLNKLLTDGLITKSEFDEQKKKLLDSYTSK